MNFKITLCPLSRRKTGGGVNGKGDCYNSGGVGRGKKVGRKVDLKEKKEK
jgi:hypothetical protein